MKIILMALLLTSISLAQASAGELVNGYMRKNGTYVSPHYRSDKDSNIYNNYRQPTQAQTQDYYMEKNGGNLNSYNNNKSSNYGYGSSNRNKQYGY